MSSSMSGGLHRPCVRSGSWFCCMIYADLERWILAFTGGGSGLGGGGLGSRGGGGGGGGDDGFSGRGGEGDYEASLRASGKSLDSLPAGEDHPWHKSRQSTAFQECQVAALCAMLANFQMQT